MAVAAAREVMAEKANARDATMVHLVVDVAPTQADAQPQVGAAARARVLKPVVAVAISDFIACGCVCGVPMLAHSVSAHAPHNLL